MDRNESLIRERKLRGWSQRDVASKIGTLEKTVSAWERKERIPGPHFQEKLCQLFGKDAEELGFLQPRTQILTAHALPDATSESLEDAESIINLSWEAWFSSKPKQALAETLKVLPRLERIRHSPAAQLHILYAQTLAIRAHGLLGTIYLDSLQNDTALHHYKQAQALASEIHDTNQSVTYLALIGDVLRRKDEKNKAIQHMELAQANAVHDHAERSTHGHVLQILAYTYADTNDEPSFERAISEATDLLAHTGEGLDATQKEFIPFEVLEIRGKANRDLGKPLQAIPYLEQAEKSLQNQIVTPRWRALLEISRAQAFCDAGDMTVGVELAMHGLLMAQSVNSPRQMNRVKKLARKLESSGYKDDRHVRDLKELIHEVYLRE